MLPCSLRYIDGEAYLYYDITSRQNIAQLFEKKPITRQWIMDFLWSMRRVRQEMSRFLLEESNIVWFPQHVYQDLEKKEFYFIYVPYCTENTGFDELMEYLVEHVDYQDESLVEYVYKAYEQYESAGEVYLQTKIFEDAECLRIPEKMDAVEEETTVVVGQDQEKDAIREEEKEMPVGEVTVIKEKKGLFNLWENRKKKEKQERDNYTRSLQLTMTGYAVAEETAYEEEDMGRTVYMEERPAPRESTHRLLSEEGKLLATLEQPIYTFFKSTANAHSDHHRRARIRSCILYRRQDCVLHAFYSVCWLEHKYSAHILTAKSLWCHGYPDTIPRNNTIMNDRGCIILRILPVNGILHHRFSQITVHISLSDTFVDGIFHIAPCQMHILTHFQKYNRHSGILTDGNHVLACNIHILLQLLQDLLPQRCFFLLFRFCKCRLHVLR